MLTCQVESRRKLVVRLALTRRLHICYPREMASSNVMHYAPNGPAICGRRRMKRKVKTRDAWAKFSTDERCTDCDAAVKREGAPRGKMRFATQPSSARARRT
jgi:hypothetical protein